MNELKAILLDKYFRAAERTAGLRNLVLLAIRFVLAYGFLNPALNKWADINGIAQWFAELGIPLPGLNAYLSASTEIAGVALLTLGLGTRLISIPLIINMIVAITTVHWSNGFEAGSNGFEIPLYYILLLFVLLINGAGKFSIDYFLSKKYK
ncbi:MAG: DoxX family protein [Ignavibacteriales bacterium]|nr:DoxX family protein [Ignavibacteriales bacterium]